jgi:hypothetical protein
MRWTYFKRLAALLTIGLWLLPLNPEVRAQSSPGNSPANALYVRGADTGGIPIRLEGIRPDDLARLQSVAVAADTAYVYVVQGSKLYQLQKDTLQVIKSVTLP